MSDARNAHPLTFRLLNPITRFTVYASVREFTAPDGVLQLGSLLQECLGLNEVNSSNDNSNEKETVDDSLSNTFNTAAAALPPITVTLVTLPRGVHAKLAPLEASYLEITDMRATLETHLRKNHATLTKGQTLVVEDISRVTRQRTVHRFQVAGLYAERYEGGGDNDGDEEDDEEEDRGPKAVDGCLILNQDVTVDIVPMSEALAEEAVRKKFAIQADGGGVGGVVGSNGALAWNPNADGGPLAHAKGTVAEDEYAYFQVPVQAEYSEYTVELTPTSGDADLFVSTLLDYPTIQDHSKYDVEAGKSAITIECDQAVTPVLYIGVLGVDASSQFELQISASAVKPAAAAKDPSASATTAEQSAAAPPPSDGSTIQCENCQVHIRAATHQLHLAYCLRHNALCPTCHIAFPKSAIADHWHCSFCDTAAGTTLASQKKHVRRMHTSLTCECGAQLYLADMAAHRTGVCPARLHVCRFCHLLLPAGGNSFTAKDLMLGGMSSHESECGARTIECRKCGANIQLKDVQTHAEMHRHLVRLQPAPSHLPCSNICCPNARSATHPNHANLCPTCFAPFWSSRDDPGHARHAQKLAGLYFQQLTQGCGRVGVCANEMCATGAAAHIGQSNDRSTAATPTTMSPTDAALAVVKLIGESSVSAPTNPSYRLCVLVADPRALKRKVAADWLVGMGFAVGWALKALVECGDDGEAALAWLGANAPPIAAGGAGPG
ncbi:hypothetical protein HDU86_008165 [Geranomyces michiganensis]|nr:hypothetical protein HDU86_008165 [Geranomyces michiganensis]